MKINDLSITFNTKKVKEAADFYVKYFNATITFDCGWYVVVRMESPNPYSLCFMDPQTKEYPMFNGGTILNMMEDDVDAAYKKVKDAGIEILLDITDQEYGDRSFRIVDPLGNIVYVYSPREVSEKYKDAIKE